MPSLIYVRSSDKSAFINKIVAKVDIVDKCIVGLAFEYSNGERVNTSTGGHSNPYEVTTKRYQSYPIDLPDGMDTISLGSSNGSCAGTRSILRRITCYKNNTLVNKLYMDADCCNLEHTSTSDKGKLIAGFGLDIIPCGGEKHSFKINSIASTVTMVRPKVTALAVSKSFLEKNIIWILLIVLIVAGTIYATRSDNANQSRTVGSGESIFGSSEYLTG